MKYFSTFSGIGGFELGIQYAYETNILIRNGKTETSRGNSPEQSLESTTKGNEHTRDFSDIVGRRNSGEILRLSPECIGYSEIDKYATQIYQKHFPNHKAYGDITKINAEQLPDFDLFVGGFPCQSFSIAGKRGGFADTRGTMFFEIARIVRKKQPRLLLLENVKGLLSHDQGRTFLTIITTLDELGYDLQWQLLNSKNHGVPQNRERIFIVGHLRGTRRPEVFPFGDYDNSSEEVRTESDGPDRDCLYSESEDGWPTERRKVSQCIDTNYWKGIDNHKQRTLVTIPRIRRLTPLECERLQGFPDGWTSGISDTQRYKTLGNAVTVNVIRDIMERLLP